MFFAGSDLMLTIRASRIMVDAHAGQFRSDGVTPFHTHPFRVAHLVAEDVQLFGRDLLAPYTAAQTVAAALVHDVPEDVPDEYRDYWQNRIAEDLGTPVLELALFLRNPSKDLSKDAPRPTKKARDREHYRDATLPVAVRLVKLCDRPDNLGDMRGWKPGKQMLYCNESEDLLAAILAGLWFSEGCRRYGKVATENAFKTPIERYTQALAAARERIRQGCDEAPAG